MPCDYASDIDICPAVGHHLHGGNHDIWAIKSKPDKHADAFANILKAVYVVARLAKERTCWKYCYEYEGQKSEHIDYAKLGHI